MKTNLVHQSINFIQFLNMNRSSLVQAFHKNKDLLKIIRQQKIQTVFQPILSLEQGMTIGYEVLNRPKSTESFPTTDTFYDFVDESNHVLTVESFLRDLALMRYAEQAHLLRESTNPLLFLNIHPKVLVDPNYQRSMTDVVAKHQLSPKQIVLELTEKQAGTDDDQLLELLSHFREQGFRIALDDVGTGYNSLQALLYLKPDFIKIDKSLIRNIESFQEKQHLVEFIVDFAKKSTKHVIAEGIETFSEFDFLRKAGIDLGQGYAIGKPIDRLMEGTIPSPQRKSK